ncbi:MAG: MCP four helix bundle domain-containing protein [Dehalococcoidia bacterium]|nr:MCP four helix bundle domain-containing protein [Dehalococcoidia bacterium]
MYRENVLGVQFALETRAHMLASARDEKRAFLAADPAQRSALVAESREAMKKAEDAMAAYHETFASAADEEQWAGVEAMVSKVIAARSGVMELLEKGDLVQAATAAAAMTADIAAIDEVLTETAQFNVDLAANSRDAAREFRWLQSQPLARDLRRRRRGPRTVDLHGAFDLRFGKPRRRRHQPLEGRPQRVGQRQFER